MNFEIGDRVVLTSEWVEYATNTFGELFKECDIDVNAFGEGTISEIKDATGQPYALVEWDNPQYMPYEATSSEPARLEIINEVSFIWMQRVENVS